MRNLAKRYQEINEMLKDDTSLTEKERKHYHQLLKTIEEQCIKEAKKLSENPTQTLKEYQELRSEPFPSVLDDDFDPWTGKRNTPPPYRRMEAWKVFNELDARYRKLDEKLRIDKSLTEEEIKYYSQEMEHLTTAMNEEMLEISKKLFNGTLKFSDLIPEEDRHKRWLSEAEKRKKRLERYKKHDPEEHYNFTETLEEKNLMKRLFDYFNSKK